LLKRSASFLRWPKDVRNELYPQFKWVNIGLPTLAAPASVVLVLETYEASASKSRDALAESKRIHNAQGRDRIAAYLGAAPLLPHNTGPGADCQCASRGPSW
jgi:hypothetical protein